MRKNKKQIYFVRHGQTELNLKGCWQGQLDSSLTSLGCKQAYDVSEKLKDKAINVVYSSPQSRAVETATIIADKLTIKNVSIKNGFAAMNVGLWQGMTYKEMKDSNPYEYDNFYNHPERFQLVGAEHYAELQQRVFAEVNNILWENQNNANNILVVSHAMVIKVLLAYIAKGTIEAIAETPVLQHTSFISINASPPK